MHNNYEQLIAKLKSRIEPSVVDMLKDYQLEGISFMQPKLTCINADEMGLGKTIQALCSLNKRGLVLAPASLKYNWKAECEKFRPDLKPIMLFGKGAGLKIPSDGELVITNTEILPDWLLPFPTRSGVPISDKSQKAKALREDYKKRKAEHKRILDMYSDNLSNTTLIIDESHIYSNLESKRNAKIQQLSSMCKRVWAMSGTPMNMGSMIKLMDMLKSIGLFHKLFQSEREYISLSGLKFKKQYNSYSGSYVQESPPSEELNRRLRSIMIRRKKESVLDLPDKIIEYVTINIDDSEVNAQLQEISSKYSKDLFDKDSLPPFNVYSHVRKAIALSRQKAMLDIVASYEASDTPLIVFSAHRDVLQPLKEREGWAYIDGLTPQKIRDEIKSNQHKYKGIALTIKANHAGHNFTSISNMLYVDLSWNYCENDQSFSRCHRIGQKNNVSIKILTSTDRFERRITEKLSIAENNIDKVIDLHTKDQRKYYYD